MFVPLEQPSGHEPKTKGGTIRYRRYWDTVGLELLRSRASKTVSQERADLELYVQANRKPVKGVSGERRELCNAPYETGCIENRLKLRCIC